MWPPCSTTDLFEFWFTREPETIDWSSQNIWKSVFRGSVFVSVPQILVRKVSRLCSQQEGKDKRVFGLACFWAYDYFPQVHDGVPMCIWNLLASVCVCKTSIGCAASRLNPLVSFRFGKYFQTASSLQVFSMSPTAMFVSSNLACCVHLAALADICTGAILLRSIRADFQAAVKRTSAPCKECQDGALVKKSRNNMRKCGQRYVGTSVFFSIDMKFLCPLSWFQASLSLRHCFAKGFP